jgi:hypothetical protein
MNPASRTPPEYGNKVQENPRVLDETGRAIAPVNGPEKVMAIAVRLRLCCQSDVDWSIKIPKVNALKTTMAPMRIPKWIPRK